MTELLVHIPHFGSIAQIAAMVQAKSVIFEHEDHYQKQTYRTRQNIYGANGKLLLNVPIQHSNTSQGHQKYKDVQIENNFHWQLDHWKSLQTAYQTSPYFEFYEADFEPLYKNRFENLTELNYACLSVIEEILEVDFGRKKTEEYDIEQPEGITDGRALIKAKKGPEQKLSRYPQVFEHKTGFLKNLSILDLIFNEGPNAYSYLCDQDINLS